MNIRRLAWTLVLALAGWLAPFGAEPRAPALSVRIVDVVTRAPIADAIVTAGGPALRSDAQGRVALDGAGATVRARAVGYLRAEIPSQALRGKEPDIQLRPFRPKALYLTVYGIGNARLRANALQLIDSTELNALVIDVKGDRGLVPYPSAVALATAVGAQRVRTVGDLPALVQSLRDCGIYTIARIVVFKDALLAQARPDLAIRRRDGSIFHDREGLAWTNPYSREVWNYNIALAIEAAKAGFDEIQFDYVRLPDTPGLAFERPWTEPNREAAIEGFLAEARRALTPFNVFLAVDVFGYICWNRNDTKIGQQIENIAGIVDYVSPMLYPSSFQFGIPGYRRPVDHPYEIVRLSLDEARRRTARPPVAFRPWLQAFRDYAFGGRAFSGEPLRLQIKAADDFGADGWMIWNPRNAYAVEDFKPSPPPR